MSIRTCLILLALAGLPACNGDVYLRDGVTDGDTFYLSQQALVDADPAYQSWVSYSLTRSTCQLTMGTDNPARTDTFECELTGRRHLLESWREKKDRDPLAADPYLDDLVRVGEAGYLGEYVAHYLGRKAWDLPADLRRPAFDRWRKSALRGHRPETRITGSWNYARNVSRTAFGE